jgi:hypothetical protein
MYKLFLDDLRNPIDAYFYMHAPIYNEEGWTIVRNYAEFMDMITSQGIPEIVSFDHDLADEHYGMQDHIEYGMLAEKTGYHCAQWLINYCIDHNKNIPKYVLIHTMNPVGRQNIESLFRTYEKVYRRT